MNDNAAIAKPKLRPVTVLAGICLLILYLALCLTSTIFGRPQIAKRNAPTPTIPPTSIPHILVHEPSDPSKVIHDDFSSNKNDWGLYFHYGKLEVINGKLILQSNTPDLVSLGTSSHISPRGDKYYIQADLSTDSENTSSYGLVFGLDESQSTFYLLELWPGAANCRLLKHHADKWVEMAHYPAVRLNPYPQANTLSVYFDQGSIELYVNGDPVGQYTDKDYFQSRDVGVYVNDSGFRLFVDDFFLSEEK